MVPILLVLQMEILTIIQLQSVCNFGQKPFKFPPPDGFQPLNAANVRPETVIARPDQYVGISTYTGNGATITG